MADEKKLIFDLLDALCAREWRALRRLLIGLLVPAIGLVFSHRTTLGGYQVYAWIALGVVGALLLAGELSSLPAPVRGTGAGDTRTIRGLVVFGEDDAAAFAGLQRGVDISRGANALLDPQFRFGVLFAESGAGTTSLLRAGVLPALKSQGYTLFINDIDNLEEPVQLVTRLVRSPENPSWLALFDSAIIANDHPKPAASIFPICSGPCRMRFQSSSDRASART